MTITVYAYNNNQQILLTAERIANKSVRAMINWEGMKVTERKADRITLECPARALQALRILKQFRRRMYRINEWAKDDGTLYDYGWNLEWGK